MPACGISIRDEFDTRNMTIAALGGQYNMIHPDVQERQDGLAETACLGVGL